MNTQLRIISFLTFTLLIGQLASIWHVVGHLHSPQHHACESLIEHTHAPYQLAKNQSLPADDAEAELCFIYHSFSANEAQLTTFPVVSVSPSQALQSHSIIVAYTSLQVKYSHIRGPPQRSQV